MADLRANSSFTANQRLEGIVRRLQQVADGDGLLHEVLDVAIEVAGADKGTLQRYDEIDDCLRIVASRGFPDHVLKYFEAVHIVGTKAGHFEPEKFEDHYENALKQLIKKKQRGEKIEKPKERPPAQVINLMEALKRSATAERSAVRSRSRRAATHHQRTSANRSSARARKAS